MLGHASPDLPPNWTASEFARFETYMASTEHFWQPDYGLTWDEGELTHSRCSTARKRRAQVSRWQ